MVSPRSRGLLLHTGRSQPSESSGEDPLPRSIRSSWDPFNSKPSKEIEKSIITISLGEGAQWSGGDPGGAQAKPLRESLYQAVVIPSRTQHWNASTVQIGSQVEPRPSENQSLTSPRGDQEQEMWGDPRRSGGWMSCGSTGEGRPSHHGPHHGPQCHSQTGLLAWIRLEETQNNQEKMESCCWRKKVRASPFQTRLTPSFYPCEGTCAV